MIKSAEGSAGLLHRNHEANDVEERGTDLGERRGRRKIAGALRSDKKRMVKTLAMQSEYARQAMEE